MSRRSEIDALDQSTFNVLANYLLATGVALFVYFLLWLIAGDWMILDYDDLWKQNVDTGEAFLRVWFIFAWAMLIPVLVGIAKIKEGHYRDRPPSETFFMGLFVSFCAGIFEEIVYRWLIFFMAMVSIRAFNAIFFGLIEWLNTTLLLPLADWITFGALEAQLIGSNWILGAAILTANGAFRDGHKYQGFFGYVNSWVLGMVFFWLLFSYGLGVAILAHIIYDVIYFTTIAVMSVFLPRRTYVW